MASEEIARRSADNIGQIKGNAATLIEVLHFMIYVYIQVILLLIAARFWHFKFNWSGREISIELQK